ncbi:MAG: hypothetical protein U5K72_04590 [Balneolaceae bacterium]|nr:hypothetical protein [Balneolaceae bacterium]
MKAITKIESARRHIDSAIELHFFGYDPIVVHTIGSAAFRVLRDLTEIKGDSSFYIYETFLMNTKRNF